VTVPDLYLRPLASLEECRACVRIQEEVWGPKYSEKVPAAMLMLANHLGGLSAGAFDRRGVLQGFVFGLNGVLEGEMVHWSDTLAVCREYRDRGLGTRLKRYQREVLLGRGIRRMHWTFDPLQGRNAHVNFGKLGIVSREYAGDMYGETGSSLHRGVGTDRLVATWEMDSARVEGRLRGTDPPPGWVEIRDAPRVMRVGDRGDLLVPGPVSLELCDPRLILPVPGHLDAMMGADLPLAIRWREVTREAFLHYLSRGYEVREFVRGDPVSAYLLVNAEGQAHIRDGSRAGVREGPLGEAGPGEGVGAGSEEERP
jgi:chorismate synthase